MMKRKVLLTFIIGCTLFVNTFSGEHNMDILFKLVPPPAQMPPTAIPTIFPLEPKDPYFIKKVYVFDIPRENSVGSLMIDYSTFTAIEFGQDQHLKYKKIKRKRDIEIADQGFTILPQKKMVGWNQGRGFQLIDLDNKKVSYWSICDNMEDNIERINVIDEDKMLFVFEIRTSDRRSYQLPPSMKYTPEDWYVILKVVDLSDKKQIDFSEKLVDVSSYNSFWTVHDKIIYYFSEKAKRLLAYDLYLKQVNPPIVDAFNKIAMVGAGAIVGYLQFHPSLPFALIGISVQNDSANIIPYHYIALLKDNECKFIPLFLGKDALSIDKFYISPDGNWVVFSYSTEFQGPPHYYYMKVNPKNPMFLEPPKYLGNLFSEQGQGITTAWSTKPTSFVVSNGLCLYRWDMEKAAAGKMQDNKH